MLNYHESCCALIKQINDSLEKQANNMLRDDDLTLTQVTVLTELDSADGKTMSLKELEHKFGVAQPTMLGIVKRLEQKGLVETLYSSEDRRAKLVHIKDLGQAKCAFGYEYMDYTERNLLRTLSEEECSQLQLLLKKIKSSL